MSASTRIGLFVCAIFFAKNGHAKLLPDFIHPCQEDNNECILKSSREAVTEFVKGLPELGVPSLDPFIIDKLSIPLNGLKTSFYNGKVTGFRKCIIDDVDSNMKKRKFFMEFHCNVTLKGKYEAVGRILVFPINGEGDAKIKLTNVKMKVNFNLKDMRDENGVLHLGVKNYKYKLEYGDKVTYDLANIFKDSKELSATVLKFLNENWRQVAEEFGQPIVDYAVELAVRTIEKFFLVVPYAELIHGPSQILNN